MHWWAYCSRWWLAAGAARYDRDVRAQLLIVALVGCGRLGFDPIDPGGPGGPGGPDGGDPGANDVSEPLAASGTCPAIAWNGTRLGVTWRDVDTVWFAATDGDGAIVDGPRLVASALQNLDCPAITWTSGDTFAIAYAHGALNKRDIDIVGDGGGAPQNVVNDAGDSTEPALVTNDGGAVAVWHDQTGTNTSVLARPLTLAGAPTGSVTTLSGLVASNSAAQPVAAGTGFAVLWAAGGGIHLRALDAVGAPAGAERSFASTDAVGPPGVAWTGADLVVSWRQFAADTCMFAREDLAGTLTMAPVSYDSPRVRARSLIALPDGFAMLWVDMYSAVEYNFALFDAAGAVVHQEAFTNIHPDLTSRTSLALVNGHYLSALETSPTAGGITLRIFAR